MTDFSSIKKAVTGAPLRSVDVPEWGCKVFFKPTSPHEAALARAAIAESDPMSYYYVQLVCLKALNESCKRIFKNDNAEEMRSWPCLETFSRIAVEMNKTVGIDEAKEDFMTTPN